MAVVGETYRDAGRLLADAGVAEPRQEALYLLGQLLGTDPGLLLAHKQEPLSSEAYRRYRRWVEQRADGVPLAYICGRTEFYARSFVVTRDVLVPRPETEVLVDRALERLRSGAPPGPIVDMGTGSGVMAVTLALEEAGRQILAVDSQPAALEVARRNADRHGVSRRLGFFRGDFWQALEGGEELHPRPALVAANPPYVADADDLAPEVRTHEPVAALLAGEDGMACHRAIAAGAETCLAAGGVLLMEMAPEQAEPLSRWLRHRGCWRGVQAYDDLADRARVIAAVRSDGIRDGADARPVPTAPTECS